MDEHTPKFGDLVIGEISKISPFGAYCKLLEYNNLETFLPLREISSGWIKNIHEFLHINQRVVCKVIYIDKSKGTIDVSLKKVTPRDAKIKINSYTLEKRSEVIIQQALKMTNLEGQKDSIINLILHEFQNYTSFLSKLSDSDEPIKTSSVPVQLQEEILKLIKSSRKKKEYKVSYILTLSTYDPKSSVDSIKQSLSDAESQTGCNIYYISSPRYHISSEADNYLNAEEKIKKALSIIKNGLKGFDIEIEKEKVKKDKEDIISEL